MKTQQYITSLYDTQKRPKEQNKKRIYFCHSRDRKQTTQKTKQMWYN